MNTTTLTGETISLLLDEKNARWSVAAPPFELAGGIPRLRLNGKDRSLKNWKTSRRGQNSVRLTTENAEGKWHLDLSLRGGTLTFRFGGILKASCPEIEMDYFDGLRIKADHVLSQGIKMGSCQSLPLNKTEKQDFTGYYQLILTRKGTQLQLAFPLCGDFIEQLAAGFHHTETAEVECRFYTQTAGQRK